MTPLSYYYSTRKSNERYDKKKSRITDEQAILWIAEDIARYLIKHKNSSIDMLICSYAQSDDFWNYCYLGGTKPYYIIRDKTEMAFYKFKRTVELQEEVVEALKTFKNIKVEEEVENIETWKSIKDYKKTVFITYKK